MVPTLTLSGLANTHTHHKTQWDPFVATFFPPLKPELVADKLDQLKEENKGLHQRLRGAKLLLAETGRNAAEALVQCQHDAADSLGRHHHDASLSLNECRNTARVARRHAAALKAQLETTNATLNHTTLVGEHTERACMVKEESLVTSLFDCQSERRQLKEEIDRRSKNEDSLQARLNIASGNLDRASSEATEKPACKPVEPKEAERPRRKERGKGGWIYRLIFWSIIILSVLLYYQFDAVRFCYDLDICRGLGRGFVPTCFYAWYAYAVICHRNLDPWKPDTAPRATNDVRTVGPYTFLPECQAPVSRFGSPIWEYVVITGRWWPRQPSQDSFWRKWEWKESELLAWLTWRNRGPFWVEGDVDEGMPPTIIAVLGVTCVVVIVMAVVLVVVISS